MATEEQLLTQWLGLMREKREVQAEHERLHGKKIHASFCQRCHADERDECHKFEDCYYTLSCSKKGRPPKLSEEHLEKVRKYNAGMKTIVEELHKMGVKIKDPIPPIAVVSETGTLSSSEADELRAQLKAEEEAHEVTRAALEDTKSLLDAERRKNDSLRRPLASEEARRSPMKAPSSSAAAPVQHGASDLEYSLPPPFGGATAANLSTVSTGASAAAAATSFHPAAAAATPFHPSRRTFQRSQASPQVSILEFVTKSRINANATQFDKL